MIVLSPHESQGIAQFEAWSCNVPTLVWDKRRWEWRDLVFEHPDVSSSPYLTEECGMRFTGAEDFEFTFDEFVGQLGGFTPRDYVLSHFTLAKSAQAYVSLMYGGGL